MIPRTRPSWDTQSPKHTPVAASEWTAIIVTPLSLYGEILTSLSSEAGVGSARIITTLDAALSAIRRGDNCPTIVILDGSRWSWRHIRFIADVKRSRSTKVLALARSVSSHSANYLTCAGADCILSPCISKAAFQHCLELLLMGERFFLTEQTIDADGLSLSDLTDREREILSFLTKGFSDKQIARELLISVGTVRIHVHNIRRRLGLRNRTQLATWAVVRSSG